MTYKISLHFENCSIKNCNNIPEFIHVGLRIALCQPCLDKSFLKNSKNITKYEP